MRREREERGQEGVRPVLQGWWAVGMTWALAPGRWEPWRAVGRGLSQAF